MDGKRTNSGPEVILRSYAEQIPVVLSVPNMKQHLLDAADEIEGLRAEVTKLRSTWMPPEDDHMPALASACPFCHRGVGDWHKASCRLNVAGQPITGVLPHDAEAVRE